MPRPSQLLHWRRSVPLAVIVLVVVAAAASLWITRSTLRFGSGTLMPRIIEPAVTPLDLRAIAADSTAGDGLLRAMLSVAEQLPEQPGRIAIDVGWSEAPTVRSRTTTRGWPLNWMTRTERSRYHNAVTREGLQRATTDLSLPLLEDPFASSGGAAQVPPRPAWQWASGRLVHHPPPEETGGVETSFTIRGSALAPQVALFLLGWAAVNVLLAVFERVKGRRLAGRTRKTALVAALIVAAVVSMWSLSVNRTSDGITANVRPRYVTMPGGLKRYGCYDDYARLQVGGKELEELLGREDADAMMAAAIIEALGTSEAEPRYLAVAVAAETIMEGTLLKIGEKIPIVLYIESQYLRRSDFGPTGYIVPPRGAGLDVKSGVLRLRWSPGDELRPVQSWSIALGWASWFAIASVGVWIVVAGACRLFASRQARRRRATGRCAACGYRTTPPL